MKCISCLVEIEPKWRHAIQQNVCPFCGASLMEEHLKGLLSSLNAAMESLQQYPEQLNDWLLSNFGFIKTDSPLLYTFLPAKTPEQQIEEAKAILEKYQIIIEPKQTEAKVELEQTLEPQSTEPEVIIIKNRNGKEEKVIVEGRQNQTKTEGFFDRALPDRKLKSKKAEKVGDKTPQPKSFASTAEQTQHYKKMVAEIKNSGGGEINMAPKQALTQQELQDMIDLENEDQDDTLKRELPIDNNVPEQWIKAVSKKQFNQSNADNGEAELSRIRQSIDDAKERFQNGDSFGLGMGGFRRSQD